MPKDPAFLFYPNDYMGGTMGMTLEEKGGYMELLILQFNKGAFTIDQAKKTLPESFTKLWPVLKEKFQEYENKFFNARLELEKTRRSAFVQKQRIAGKKGGRPKKKHHGENLIQNPTLNPNETQPLSQKKPFIENENENEDRIRNENGEGGAGETKLWTQVKRDFLNSEEWQFLFCSEKGIDRQELIKKMQEFISDLDLKEEYKDLRGLKNHFTNWFNKKQNGQQPTNSGPKLGTSAARVKTARDW